MASLEQAGLCWHIGIQWCGGFGRGPFGLIGWIWPRFFFFGGGGGEGVGFSLDGGGDLT